MKIKLQYAGFLLLTFFCLLFSVNGQSPTVEKVEPPSWWTNSSINPVRVLLTGKNLKGETVWTNDSALKASNIKASENGNYLFFDLMITKNAKAGKYKINVGNKHNVAAFDFEIVPKKTSATTHRGYTPDDVIYFVIPDRFADGDTSNNDPAKSKGLYDRKFGRHYHGGDLQGLIDKLPYLKSLGVTAIWTTPIYDNNDKPDYKETYEGMPFTTGYHGYGATDMYAVDEHLGDMAKLREFVQKAQAMGFKVIQDQVANHTGPYHRWADDPPTPTWWNGTVKNHPNNNWQKWTAMNPRATYQTQSRNIDGWFIDILPDFNQNDIEVEKYLIQNTLWWVETVGFDAIRMDTLPHVPRTFWGKWGSAIKKEFPKVNVLGELFDGDPVLISYFQAGRKGHDGVDTKIDTLYDFALFYQIRNAFAKGGSIRGVSQMLARDWIYPNPNVLTTFLGVHDMERFMNEEGATTEGLKLAQTFIMTTRGTPLLYYGDEIAMPGGSDPDNRRDFPGGFAGDAANAFNASGRTPEQNDVWNHLAKLGSLRKELEPLRNGKSLDLLDEEQQSVYARVSPDQAVLVVFNNDTKTAEVRFDVSMIKQFGANSTLTDRLGKISDVKIQNGKVSFTMPARSAGIFTIK
ncbi:MAG: cyclomaltodextrinase N-terminal domain-containing protein [Pyrinomonadaceae bacterium]|nr:cyclomaltodextrinase N-terminal domain-containing protein [Pyrinomonadaceae bacterium]